MADGHDFEKKTLNVISLQPFMKFGMMMHSPPNLTVNRKFKNLEIQDGGRRPS